MKDVRRSSFGSVVGWRRILTNALLGWTVFQFLVTRAVAARGLSCEAKGLKFSTFLSHTVKNRDLMPFLAQYSFDIVEVLKNLKSSVPPTEAVEGLLEKLVIKKYHEINLEPLFQAHKDLLAVPRSRTCNRGREITEPVPAPWELSNSETLPANWLFRYLLAPLNSANFSSPPPRDLRLVTRRGNAFVAAVLMDLPEWSMLSALEEPEPQDVPPCAPEDSTLRCIGKALEMAKVNVVVVTDKQVVDRWRPFLQSIPNIYLWETDWAPIKGGAGVALDAVIHICCGSKIPISEHAGVLLPGSCEGLQMAANKNAGTQNHTHVIATRSSPMPLVPSTTVAVERSLVLSTETPRLRKRAVRDVKDVRQRNLSEAPYRRVSSSLVPDLGGDALTHFIHEDAASAHHSHTQENEEANGLDDKRRHVGNFHHNHTNENFSYPNTVKTLTSQTNIPLASNNSGPPTLETTQPLTQPSAKSVSTGTEHNHVQGSSHDDLRGLGSIVTVAVSGDDASSAEHSKIIATTANNAGVLSTTSSTVLTVAVVVARTSNATRKANGPLNAVTPGVATTSTLEAFTPSSTVVQGKPLTTGAKEKNKNIQTESKVLAQQITKIENDSPAPVSAEKLQSKKDVEATELKPAGVVEGKPESSSPFFFVGCIFVGLALCTIVGMLLYHYCTKASAKKLHSNVERTADAMEIPRSPEERGVNATTDYRPYA